MTTSNTEIARLASITATERAQELNAETQAWVDAAPGRGAGFLVEDAEFWAQSGVTTGLELERSLLVGGFSDSYKEFNGIRPRWVSFEGLTFAECEAQAERLLPTAAEWEARAAEWEAEEAADALAAEQAVVDAGEDALWAIQDRLMR